MTGDVAVELMGESGSFPGARGLPEQVEGLELPLLVVLGEMAALPEVRDDRVVAIELGLECLGVHTGEARGQEGSNVVGFARFRLGTMEPSSLVEVVRQPNTSSVAIAVVTRYFQAAGLQVAVCADVPGRIVNRLARPYYNAALTSLDEGLASAADIDQTVRLGLGYPHGPIELLESSGLTDHHRVSQALYDALGDRDFLPARRAQVAHRREQRRPT